VIVESQMAGLVKMRLPKMVPKDVVIDLVAGSLGATASVYVGQPMDTLKVKMQTFPHLYPTLGKCLRFIYYSKFGNVLKFLMMGLLVKNMKRVFKYFVTGLVFQKGLQLKQMRDTWNKDGLVRGLYAGTSPSLIANIAENSILFAANGVCQKFLARMSGKTVENLSPLENGISGFLAAFWSSLALCPTELVKCRLQAMREAHAEKGLEPPKIGPLKLTQQILRSEGPRGLFHGLTPTFAREMPGYFFFFMAYEASRELLTPAGKTKDEIGLFRTAISGGIAGVTLWTVIFPADVIKSRQQVSGISEPMFKAGYQIFRNEGILALYNGLLPTVIRTFPATGALFCAVEYSKKFMNSF